MKNVLILLDVEYSNFIKYYPEAKEYIKAISSDINVYWFNFRHDDDLGYISSNEIINESIYDAIETADVIVCDISRSDFNNAYELGYAHGIRKPVIMVAENNLKMPFDVKSSKVLIYDSKSFNFLKELQLNIKNALSNPTAFSNRPTTQPEINSVFISYSHKDSDFLKRLLVHLRPLEKEKLIDLWVDTKIETGDKWKNEINEALNRARVAILLVTADFLASDFIVDNELPPLLAKAEVKGTRIIPVILKPCRFTRDKNLGHFQAINSPESPIVNLSEGEQEQIYDHVAQQVERWMVR